MARTDPTLTATLAAIQQTLEALSSRVARLEAQLVDVYAHEDDEPAAPAVVVERAGHGPVDDANRQVTDAESRQPITTDAHGDIDPDVVLVIAAAVAAYLGERAHVKQIRLVSSQAWGRQGRVSVQASHRLYR